MSDRIPKSVMENICIRKCGSHGKCTSGVCVCDDGYTGETCDVSASVPPQVIPVNPSGGACDVGSADCSQVALFGFDFVESSTLTCHYEYIQVEETVKVTGEHGVVSAEFISMYQVNCHLPRSQSAYISVSNDGRAKSAARYLHVVHDAKCYSCDILQDGAQAKCSRQADTCMIGDACFQSGEKRGSDKCQICDPLKDQTQWVKNPDPLCNAERLNGAEAQWRRN
ncbi:uncharacterized protein LOC121384643 [Gigantopelta aegis]|uniref:uncharacterized protein LOC121384643 n=1 Tax=Gigantopelta aegis TaxID=1735272 RepID=UPI001B887DE7|nr:uncharacterized protein LOC121384643 [Gigantopelta aegis]